MVVRLVIDQLTAPRKCFSIIMVFDVFDSSVYKGSSLAILAMLTQFMMECNFFTTHKGGRDIDIGGYKYLTFREGKDGKEFGICSN